MNKLLIFLIFFFSVIVGIIICLISYIPISKVKKIANYQGNKITVFIKKLL